VVTIVIATTIAIVIVIIIAIVIVIIIAIVIIMATMLVMVIRINFIHSYQQNFKIIKSNQIMFFFQIDVSLYYFLIQNAKIMKILILS